MACFQLVEQGLEPVAEEPIFLCIATVPVGVYTTSLSLYDLGCTVGVSSSLLYCLVDSLFRVCVIVDEVEEGEVCRRGYERFRFLRPDVLVEELAHIGVERLGVEVVA